MKVQRKGSRHKSEELMKWSTGSVTNVSVRYTVCGNLHGYPCFSIYFFDRSRRSDGDIVGLCDIGATKSWQKRGRKSGYVFRFSHTNTPSFCYHYTSDHR